MFTKSKYKIIASVLLLIFTLTGCTKGGTTEAKSAYKAEVLNWWSVWDDYSDVIPLIDAYRAQHPNVRVDYRKLRYEEYEKELINALAEDRGPDVFSIHNTWMKRYVNKLLPAPASVSLPIKYTTGGIKKEEVVEFRTNNLPSPAVVRKNFLDVVSPDVIMLDETGAEDTWREKVWGLPMSMDTLVMFYNKDILNNAGIVEPAKSWTEFQDHVKRITKISSETGEILLSGGAIGTADNVERSFDILSLLMMQNLTPMTNQAGYATFTEAPKNITNIQTPPAIGAIDFYVQFASPLHEIYTWNNQMPNSIDAFIDGKVAYIFGYSYYKDRIMAEAPQLNWSIASMPQVGDQQKVNYASYWVQGVSKKSKVPQYAWDFVNFITAEANVPVYLNKAGTTTALRSTKLINEHLANEALAVQAEQLLTAKSWYRGQSPLAAEDIFATLINSVLQADVEVEDALKNSANQINYSINNSL